MKIPLKRVDSSNCAVYVGRRIVGDQIVEQGQPYFVHKGEWVEILPVTSIGEYIDYSMLIGRDWSGMTAEQRADIMRSGILHTAFEKLVGELSRRVYDWNWTDIDDQPLPKPHNNPEAIRLLNIDELMWLMSQAEFEPEVERKNASKPSPSTPSGEGRHQRRRG